jgi:acyl-CoA thioester hydrolase
MTPSQITLAIPVRTYDVDFVGIVSNIVYIRWLEDLRLQMLAEYFPLDIAMQAQGIAPLLLRTEIDYKRPVRLFDALQGRMWLAEAGRARQVLAAEFTVDGRVHAVARQTTCFIDLASGRPVATPPAIRALAGQDQTYAATKKQTE